MAIRLVWELSSPAPPEPTWDVFSDTERLMAAMGTIHTYYDEPREDGGIRRLGRSQKMGMTLEWEEPPFSSFVVAGCAPSGTS
ncbi:MAG TPA: hypothetical protein QGF58_02110 [Myxococcota bacterium]|nr:hypothetical protein [Myxococcota bacterium]